MFFYCLKIRNWPKSDKNYLLYLILFYTIKSVISFVLVFTAIFSKVLLLLLLLNWITIYVCVWGGGHISALAFGLLPPPWQYSCLNPGYTCHFIRNIPRHNTRYSRRSLLFWYHRAISNNSVNKARYNSKQVVSA